MENIEHRTLKWDGFPSSSCSSSSSVFTSILKLGPRAKDQPSPGFRLRLAMADKPAGQVGVAGEEEDDYDSDLKQTDTGLRGNFLNIVP